MAADDRLDLRAVPRASRRPTQPYHGRYTGRRLWRVADRLGAWLDEGCDVYAYFNNDFHGAAVDDATWLRDRLTPSLVAQPAGGDGPR